jgi:hypothetical protein
MIVLGLSSMLMVNTINVTIQNSVTDELRGRVMSLYVTVFAGSAPIGGFFAGSVAELWGPPAGFLLGAGIASIFVVLVGWKMLGAGSGWADAMRRARATDPAPGPERQRAAGE